MLALQCDGSDVTTIEGMAKGTELQPLQKSFLENAALQCGICTPGMLMAATDLLARNAQPNEQEVKDALGGVLCRCTGYVKVLDAIDAVAKGTPGRKTRFSWVSLTPATTSGSRAQSVTGSAPPCDATCASAVQNSEADAFVANDLEGRYVLQVTVVGRHRL